MESKILRIVWIGILILAIISALTATPHPYISYAELTAGAIAAIYGGAALAGGGVNAAATGKMNRQSRLHSLRMYERQLRDQREYNSPEATMQRYKDAGLNPHLIYGTGASTEKVPTMQPAQFDTSNPGDSITQAAAGGIKAYQDTRQMQSSLALDAQDLVNKKKQEAVLNAQALKIMTDIDKTTLDTQFKRDAYDYNLDLIVSKAEGADLENELKAQKFDLNEAMNARSEKELLLKTAELAMKMANSEEQRKAVREAVRLSQTRRSEIRQNMHYQRKEWTNFENGINMQSDYLDQQAMDPDNPEWVKIGYNLLQKAGGLIQSVGEKVINKGK